jgi:hypothetical protein
MIYSICLLKINKDQGEEASDFELTFEWVGEKDDLWRTLSMV